MSLGVNTAQAQQQAVSGDIQLTAAGWGATETGYLADQLLDAPVQVVDRGECQRLFLPFNSRVTRRMVCATGEWWGAGSVVGV